jgi:hypothetical protein
VLEAKKLKLPESRVYEAHETGLLLEDCGKYLSFIGCVIIKKALWESREKSRYFGCYFIHVGVIFQEPIPHNTLVIANPLISIRYGNATWFGKYFEIWMVKWPSLIWSLAAYPAATKAKVCSKEPWDNPARLLLFRAKGAYTMKEYRQWLEPRLASYRHRIVSKAIACLPGVLVNFMAVVHYALISRDPARFVVLIDMTNSPYYFWKRKT